MSDVEPKAGDPVLPSFKQMMSKIADADHLAEKIDRKMFEIYQSVTKNFKLDDRDQKDLRRARTEAAGLHSQVGSLRNAVFECQSEGWRQCHERVLDLYNDCVHMLDILEAANRDLNSIMAGDKTRVNARFFDRVHEFADRFSRMSGSERSRVTVTHYQVRVL